MFGAQSQDSIGSVKERYQQCSSHVLPLPSTDRRSRVLVGQFVIAGDFLVENFPTWSWGSGLPEKRRSHLPAEKQFLQTRDVPCLPLKQTSGDSVERIVEDDEDGGWVETGDDAIETINDIDSPAVAVSPCTGRL